MEITINNYTFFYYKTSITASQISFLKELSTSIESGSKLLIELPAQLDKDFLILSCLFSLNLTLNKSFVLLTSSQSNVHRYLRYAAKLSRVARKFNKHFFPRISPFFPRKAMCNNADALEKASSLDIDYFCRSTVAANKCLQFEVLN